MAQGESNRIAIRISKETVWNETPATPVMAALPYLSDTLIHDKRVKQSAVLRSDRMKDSQVQVGVAAAGDISFELRFADFNVILAAALASAFVAQSTTGAGSAGNFQFAAAGAGVQVITGPASWTTNYSIGSWVRIKLATNSVNNGVFKVTAISGGNLLTVANPIGVAENSSVAVIAANTMRNGTTKQSLLIEKQYTDLTTNYINFRGMRVSALSLSIKTEDIITGTVSFMGPKGNIAVATLAGSVTAASANDSMTASTNVGTITEGGAALSTAIKTIALNVNCNARALAAVANVAAIGINLGSFAITGTLEAYFEDQTLYTKVINHTSSSLVFQLNDPQGNTFVFTLAQLKFSGNPNNPGIDQDVMLPLTFACERQPTDNYMIQVDALAA